MKTTSFREEFFPSLPHVETKCFVDNKQVTRGEYMKARTSAGKVIADESHSCAGKTVNHIITEALPS